MRILFVHPEFPGPFRHMASRLGEMPDMAVLFLSGKSRRETRIPGVRRIPIPLTGTPAAEASKEETPQKEMDSAMHVGASVANALLGLRKDGFIPDILCAAADKGCSLYIRDVYPSSFYVAYANWFYTRGLIHTFFTRGKSRPPKDFSTNRIRNLLQLNALNDCDVALTSTHWQQAQFPDSFAEKIHVLHDGINTSSFSPWSSALFPDGTAFDGAPLLLDGYTLSREEEIVSFSCFGIEPFRGFIQFCRSIPFILESRPHCHIVIKIFKPAGEKSCTAIKKDDLPFGKTVDLQRVHLVETVSPEEYRRILRHSTVHVYLTAPFALSSGLFEAMSCGCLVVGSDTEPVCEAIRHGENGFLCNFWDVEGLAATVSGVLERAPQMGIIRQNARKTVLERYDAQALAPLHLRFLLDSYAQMGKK